MTPKTHGGAGVAPDLNLVASDALFETKQEILDLDDRQFSIITVPPSIKGWGGRRCRLVSLTVDERDAFENSVNVQGPMGVRTNMVGARAKLVVKTLVNSQGARIFADEDAPALGAKNAAAVNFLFEESSKLSGILKRDMDELVGNSAAARTSDSSSASPSTSSTDPSASS